MIPFDQYQRYHFIQKALDILAQGRRCKIVEIGSGEGILRELSGQHTLTLVDPASIGNKDVRASGTMLPFADRAFDLVVSTDTLEHIPPDNRKKLLQELVRVAAHAIILGFPHNDELVRQSDRILFQFIKSIQGMEYPFLKEHADYGLPEAATIREILNQTGVELMEFRNTNLFSWLPLMMSNFLMEKNVEFRQSYEMLNDVFNRYYEKSSHCPPHYRTFLVCLRSKESRALREKLDQLQGEDADRNSNDFALTSLLLGFSFQSSLQDIKQQVTKLETEKEQRDELIRERSAIIAQLEIHLDASNAQKEELQKQLATLDKHRAILQQQKEEGDTSIRNLESRLLAIENEKRESEKIISGQIAAVGALKDEVAHLQKQKEEAGACITKLQSGISDFKRQREEDQITIEQQAKEIKNLQDYLNLFLTHPAYKVYRTFKHLLGKK